MKILVSNDDGIHAQGIQTLIEHLALEGHELYVIAPDRERSAMGHALTLHRPIKVHKADLPYQGVKVAYAISGTPSDCVKLGLSTLIEDEIDVVLSGINHGPNLGGDVMYSGTVSAALEGAIFDKPSIAVSYLGGHDKDADFNPAASYICKNLEKLLATNIPKKSILNVNFPSVPLADVVGTKVCKLGMRLYTDTYEKRIDPRDNMYYWLVGEMITQTADPNDDVDAIQNNYVTVTPVHIDLTDHDRLEVLSAQLE